MSPRSILVVDDDACMRELASELLGRAGHDVRQAVDGREGLRELFRRAPDLVVLDVSMPELDGWAYAGADPRSQRGAGADADRAKRASSRRSAACAAAPTTTSASRSGARSCSRAWKRSYGERHPPPRSATRGSDGWARDRPRPANRARRHGRADTERRAEFRLLAVLAEHRGQVLAPTSCSSSSGATPRRMRASLVKLYVGYLRLKFGLRPRRGLADRDRSRLWLPLPHAPLARFRHVHAG